LVAPAIVYGLNTFGRVRNGLYDKLKEALEGIENKNVGDPQKMAAPPNIAVGSAPAMLDDGVHYQRSGFTGERISLWQALTAVDIDKPGDEDYTTMP